MTDGEAALEQLTRALALPPRLRVDPALVRRAVDIVISLDSETARAWLKVGELLRPRQLRTD
jgi:hypothetical protein